MITSDIIESVIDHKKNRKIVIFKAFNKDVPTWDEFINYLDTSSHIEPSEEDGVSGDYAKGNVMTKEHFYYYMFSHGYLGQASKDIESALSMSLSAPGGMSGVFINFSSNIIDVRPHRDPQDNFYWQCIGSTEWVFDGQTHIVEPGDVIFIPASAEHAVNFSMPRAAISFWYELDKSPAILGK